MSLPSKKNLDGAGSGNLRIFTDNVKRKLPPNLQSMVEMHNGSSLETTAGDLCSFTRQRPVAFFSIEMRGTHAHMPLGTE